MVAMFVNGSEQNDQSYREPSIDASYQFSVHLAERFQRRRLKCEKLTDDGCQKPWAKKENNFIIWITRTYLDVM